MRKLYTLLSVIAICLCNLAYGQLAVPAKLPSHPRLLLLAGQEKDLLKNINSDQALTRIHESVIKNCDAMVNIQPLRYKKIGKRLLDVSREALHRIFYLSYGYRMTGNKLYLRQAERELNAVCSFDNWNPTHFLDVGEMTMAVSIGYDWLYNELSDSTKTLAKKAILNKGINPSFDSKYNGWLKVNNNWNQVCNAGMVYGAMVTYEDHPDLSVQVINRAIQSVDLPMKAYQPDGAYPEGYGYWEYGTSFNVMMISALQTAFGKDFGLSEKPGFLKTPGYLENMTGATGMSFNYSDSGTGAAFNPAMFWFADKLHDPSLLWTEKELLFVRPVAVTRIMPATLIWGRNMHLDKITKPKATMWVGSGANPVALMRTAWGDPNATYLAIKGGSPSVNHAHMDIGTFVMETEGVRWGIDLGAQDYESLESKGVDLWNGKQNSQRWQVLRYNNHYHNTLTIDTAFQLVKGYAPIVSYSKKPDHQNAILNLSSVYSSKVAKAMRGAEIVGKQVLIRDEITSLNDTITIRWSMVTKAHIQLGNSMATLTQNNKSLKLNANCNYSVQSKTWNTNPTHFYDAPNPGTAIVGFEVKVPPHSQCNLSVSFVSGDDNASIVQSKPLSQWPKD